MNSNYIKTYNNILPQDTIKMSVFNSVFPLSSILCRAKYFMSLITYIYLKFVDQCTKNNPER
jgi:hypothetical protein